MKHNWKWNTSLWFNLLKIWTKNINFKFSNETKLKVEQQFCKYFHNFTSLDIFIIPIIKPQKHYEYFSSSSRYLCSKIAANNVYLIGNFLFILAHCLPKQTIPTMSTVDNERNKKKKRAHFTYTKNPSGE